MTTRLPGPTAAIAWIRAGIQAQGLYTGYRQLVVRFAAEAETATLYNGSMLLRNIERTLAHSVVHSVSIAGHDPLASATMLAEAFVDSPPGVPVVIDCDGQRPDVVPSLSRSVAVVQVILTGTEASSVLDTAVETLRLAQQSSISPALAVVMTERTTDVQVLRLLEQVNSAVRGTKIVVHLASATEAAGPDARYGALMREASALVPDVRLLARLPAPLGLR